VNNRLLIVGGTGFIGRNLTQHAIVNSLRVTVLSLNLPSKKEMIEGVNYIQSDLTDLDDLKNVLLGRTFEYVVNLSGYIDHSIFSKGGRKIIETHFGGMQNLLKSLNKECLKRFVQIGSSDEYGDSPAPQNENMREAPMSPYSLAKVASTQLLQMLYKSEGIPSVILRLFLVYGPNQNSQRFLPQIIRGCLLNEKFPVSAGEQLRDFCFVDDISDGILKALSNDKASGEIINLASGKPIAIRTVVELVRSSVGLGVPEFGKVPYRTGENMELFADVLKAKNLLNWKPMTSIEQGLDSVINDYKRREFDVRS
jgi:nucleoside-diphosphate-sugar epimerase